MSDTIEYIEAYFQKQLSDDENREFEKRCVEDEFFAREVARYISLDEAIREKILHQKQQEWKDSEHDSKSLTSLPVKNLILGKWLPYVAAACLIIAVGIYFIYSSARPQQFANKYITEHFSQLSQTMDGSKDTLQQGIAAYNNKDYRTALQLFEKVNQSHPDNRIAKRNIGLVYLVTKDFDKALQQFDELAAMKGYNNPGVFLKAVTLLQRNKQGDKEQAKKFLEEVVNQNAGGKREAENLLKRF